MRESGSCLPAVIVAATCGFSGLASSVQAGNTFECGGGVHWEPLTGPEQALSVNCEGAWRCYRARQPADWYVEVEPECDPNEEACGVELRIPLRFPGVGAMYQQHTTQAPYPYVFWFDEPTAGTCSGGSCTPEQLAVCGYLSQLMYFENVETWRGLGALSCDDLASSQLVYSILARTCPSSSCPLSKTINGLYVASPAFSRAMGCSVAEPPMGGCGEGASGAGAACCVGSGGSTPATGQGPSVTPPGHAATLTYQAGGVGTAGLPGSGAWRTALGRNWSHEFAERIVIDPDVGTDAAVWLLTRWGTFRKFTDLASGIYGTAAPSDEYRALRRTGGGWELEDLDGTIVVFDANGLWQSTTDRNGNAYTNESAGAQLTEVAFPDGRTETFEYDASGRLESITQIGVDGPPATRTWNLTWLGDDLVRIDRPDGTAWQFEYGDTLNPGYMTRMYLVPTSGSPRVEGAWEYDMWGNVTRTWRGAANFTDGGAVDKWEFDYDDPEDPTETTITDPLGVVSTRTYERDTVSRKPRVTEVSGACSVCGASPETTWAYEDSNHPLLPTTITDGDGTETVLSYDAHGRLESRTEAADVTGHPHLPRITEWQYDPNFPAFPIEIAGPTKVGQAHTRIVSMAYDGVTGDLDSRTIEGDEATYPTGSFSLTTTFEYTAEGQVETIDPPGYGSADETSFTYNVPDTNGMLPDTRTDPLVGTWEFGYDAFNRRISVEDPNGVVTETSYDLLDRVTAVVQRGATSGDDLTTSYFYSPFGDLHCVKKPMGNAVQYFYDSAGRMTEMRVGLAMTSPTATACLSISSTNFAERKLWTLDGAGHRVSEDLERGTSSTAWTTHAQTAWEYSTMCHLDRTIQAPGAAEEAVTEYAFDCNGNLESIWDANHPRDSFPSQPSTTFGYDELDRLVTTTQPWGGSGGGTVTTSYDYDVQDHLVEVTDGEGTVTSYVYSDRDLMTEQVSEVSGTTSYTYNEHGELVSETDARAITIDRAVDAADRVTFADYPGSDLDVTYSWGSSAANFDKGRLVSIATSTSTIDYTYDRFGRILQDGDLVYQYDKNSNRTSILYPAGLEAIYTHDRMDRENSLSIREIGGSPVAIVQSSPAASYRAFGPLASLRFRINATTNRDEVRSYDLRYLPTKIEARATSGNPPTAFLDWNYTTDGVGNVVAIDDLVQSSSWDRSFDYQDWQYFLTEATGPWPGPLAWTYDKAGNRLTETRDSITDDYSYQLNAATTGNTSLLDAIDLDGGGGGTQTYSFDAAGYLEEVELASFPQPFDFDAAGRLAEFGRNFPASIAYDGRGFACALGDGPVSYSSDGVLRGLPNGLSQVNLVYFDGRPILSWEQGQGTLPPPAATLRFLTVDSIGTPIHAFDSTAATAWFGGFEPFGRDFQEGTSGDALGHAAIYLRLPGQWENTLLRDAGDITRVYQNVHRWYEAGTGRYVSVDPEGVSGQSPNHYSYVRQRPLAAFDSLGLRISFIHPALAPYIDCALRDAQTREAWEYFESDDDDWEFRPLSTDQRPFLRSYGRTALRRKQANSDKSSLSCGTGTGCSTVQNPGGLAPWDWFKPGQFALDTPNDPADCTFLVEQLIHELRERYISRRDKRPHQGVHYEITGPARQTAKDVCSTCCPRWD